MKDKMKIGLTFASLSLFVVWIVWLSACEPMPESVEKTWGKIGTVDLDPGKETLSSLNQIFLQEATEKNDANSVIKVTNTKQYEWYGGNVSAEIFQTKIINLRISKRGSLNFPASIFGVRLGDRADNIRELLEKSQCRDIKVNGTIGEAVCRNDWKFRWSAYEGLITDLSVQSLKYTLDIH